MPRSVEVKYYSELIASLVVSAVRATDPAVLSQIHGELTEALDDIFTLLSHDAQLRPSVLPDALLARLAANVDGAPV